MATDGAERGFQLCAADLALAGDEAGGIVACRQDHFRIADRGGGVRGEVEGAGYRVDDHVAAGDQGLCLGTAGEQSDGDCGAEQVAMHGELRWNEMRWACLFGRLLGRLGSFTRQTNPAHRSGENLCHSA